MAFAALLALVSVTIASPRNARAQLPPSAPLQCAEAALESPTKTCDGPWRYEWGAPCSDEAICGPLECAEHNQCLSYEQEVGYEPHIHEPPVAFTAQCTEQHLSQWPWLVDNCPDDWLAQVTWLCSSFANTRFNALYAEVTPTTASNYNTWLTGLNVEAQTQILSGPIRQSNQQLPPTATYTVHYSCELDIFNSPKKVLSQTPECGCAALETCICETGEVLTAPAPDAPMPTTAGPGLEFVVAPVCTTCDDPAFDPASGDASAMLACLQDGLAGLPLSVRQERAARMKLLLQLAGDQLQEHEREEIHAVYDHDTEVATECQEPIFTKPGCEAQLVLPDGVSLVNRMQLCVDLGAAHVPDAVAETETRYCLEVLAQVAALAPSSCRDTLLKTGADRVGDLLVRTAPGALQPASRHARLVTMLRQLDQWHQALSSFGDTPLVHALTSDVVGRVWGALHEATQPLPTSVGTDTAAATLLLGTSASGLDADHEMVEAIFDLSSPIVSAPLLLLLGDALRGTVERMEQVSPTHDVACRFVDCATGGPGGTPMRTALTDAWRAVAALGDPGQLADVLADATALAAEQPALYSALEAAASNGDPLQLAWERISLATISALGEPGGEVPPEAEALAALVRTARLRSQSYDATGLLDASRARLTSAVLHQQALADYMHQTEVQLGAAVDDYEAARLATVNDLLAEVNNQGGIVSVADRAEATMAHAKDLVDQLDGLRAREESERAALADFMRSFESVIDSEAFDGDAAYQVDVLPGKVIGPYNAQFPVGATLDLPLHRAHVVSIGSGKTLEIDVIDPLWTPTCALDMAALVSPAGTAADVDVDGAVAGPDGYVLSWSGSSYEAFAHTDTQGHTFTDGESGEACGGTSIGGSIQGVVTMGGSVKNCASWSSVDSSGWTKGTSDGNEGRTTASFNGGVRLPFTPFPTAPVGSLLAVITPQGDLTTILDVQVVGVRDSIHTPVLSVPIPLDIHFVVNDVESSACAPPVNDTLQLEMRVVTPVGLVAKAMGRAMGEALADIEAQAPAILAQGGMTQYDAGEMRTGAWANLTLRLSAEGYGIAQIPAELRSLYEAWIEKRIASLGRRGEMDRVQREFDRLTLDLIALGHEAELGETRTRLLSMIPQWRLRDLAGVTLRPAVEELSRTLTDYAAPILDLRDSNRMAQFRSANNAQLQALLHVSFEASMDEVSEDLIALSLALRSAIQTAQFELPVDARRTLAIAYPRTPTSCTNVCNGFRQAPATAARQLWDGITGTSHIGELRVQPADLYAAAGGNSVLSCHDLAPVVRRAGVFLLNQADPTDLQILGRELPAVAGRGGSSFVFPSVGRLLELSPDTDDGVPMGLPVMNGMSITELMPKFGNNEQLSAGAGISPFGAFSVDFNSFYGPGAQPAGFLQTTAAVFLVVEVERRLSVNNAYVAGPCVAPAP